MKLTERQLPTLIGLGLVWGIIEVYLSPIIKSLEPALFGLIMPFFIIMFILTARRLLPVLGTTFLMGVIAAFMEYMLTGMVPHGAGTAILMEALGAEIILSLGAMRLFTFPLVGIYVELYSAFHPLIFRGTFCQSKHVVLFKHWLIDNLNIPAAILPRDTMTFIVVASHTIVGILAGLIFMLIVSKIDKRQSES